jgi:serine O-acetyltransferase
MKTDPDFESDLARYPPRPFLKEQSIWAISVYRFGRRVLKRKPGLLRNLQLKFYWLLFRLVETATGISLPLEAQIGPGLRIHHFGNIFINSNAIIGRNCTLRQGVTIGNRVDDGPSPVVEDDVEFGAYAQAFGGIHIAKGAKIGALSVVLCDIPAGATAVGIPAEVIKKGLHDRSLA